MSPAPHDVGVRPDTQQRVLRRRHARLRTDRQRDSNNHQGNKPLRNQSINNSYLYTYWMIYTLF